MPSASVLGGDGSRPTGGPLTRPPTVCTGDNVEKIDPELRSAWAAVSAMLTSKEVERAVRIKLNDGLAIRARGDKVPSADDLKLVAKPVVYRDRDGYQIKPPWRRPDRARARKHCGNLPPIKKRLIWAK